MKPYNEMNSFELSCEVAKKRGYPFVTNGGKVFADIGESNPSPAAAIMPSSGRCFVEFSINNWGDMGPVINEIFDYLTDPAPRGSDHCVWSSIVARNGCSPLRAAAICYLEMN